MREYVYALLIFSVFAIGFGMYISTFSDTMGQTTEDIGFLNTSRDIYGNITEMQNVVNQSEGEISVIGVFTVTSNAVLQILKIMLFVPAMIGEITAKIGEILHIPALFVQLILTIVVVSVIFKIVTATGRFKS